jgi:hypothetical protein
MSKHTFDFYHHDFGDMDDGDIGTRGESVWVAAWVDGVKGRGIGAYVDREGRVMLNDNIAWCVENDLADLGIDPSSKEAITLVDEWCAAALEHGLSVLGPARTDVRIVDVGTLVKFAHDRRGITIQKSGGVPVQNVVGAVDFSAPIRDVADALLTAWRDGYDGDPRENELHVEVSRDGETETVYA